VGSGSICRSWPSSKAALEAMSESLAMEAAGLGVRVTIVEPGGYWTDLYSSMRTAVELPASGPPSPGAARCRPRPPPTLAGQQVAAPPGPVADPAGAPSM
jgi:NAD(P)-dependent dehydrogenase (short-subunit alcohol dehydrogenase family)